MKRRREYSEPKSPGVTLSGRARLLICPSEKATRGKYDSHRILIPLSTGGLNSTQIWKRRFIAGSMICLRFVVEMSMPSKSSICVINPFVEVRSHECEASALLAKKESA